CVNRQRTAVEMLRNKRLPCAIYELLQSCTVPARRHSNPYRTISRHSEASHTRRLRQFQPMLSVGTGRTQFPARERCPIASPKRSRIILDKPCAIVLSVVALRLRSDDLTYPRCALRDLKI